MGERRTDHAMLLSHLSSTRWVAALINSGAMAPSAVPAPMTHSKWLPLCDARSTSARTCSANACRLSSTLVRSSCFPSAALAPARCWWCA